MCGVQLVILELMIHSTVLFLWITIQNTFGSILWQLNPVCLLSFHSLKNLLKQVLKKIKTLYSDNGGEFIALKSYFSSHGITHYTTAPYSPQ